MEAFSRMLLHTENASHIRGIRASQNGPHINHLFFADDALLFVRNKKSEVKTFMKILRKFVQVSGKKINLDKSMVFFSLNTLIDQRQLYGDLLHVKVVDNLDNYLGLPLFVGKKKFMAFHSILDRFSCRTNSWFKRLLSYGGKEIFIKSILQSLLTYALSFFLTPRGILEDM